MQNVAWFLVSVMSIIASVSCIFVVRVNAALIRETRMLYKAIDKLMLEAVWPERDS